MAVQEALCSNNLHAEGLNGITKSCPVSVPCQAEKQKLTCQETRKSIRAKHQLIHDLAGNQTKPNDEHDDKDSYCMDGEKVKLIELTGSTELIEIQPNGIFNKESTENNINKGFFTPDVDTCYVDGPEKVIKNSIKRRIVINLDDKNKFTDEVTV